MYITVTNVCVWLQTVDMETLLEVRLHVSELRINSQGIYVQMSCNGWQATCTVVGPLYQQGSTEPA